MPGISVPTILGGPALVSFRGATFYSKGDILLEVALQTFPIEVDAYRQVDERVRRMPVRCRFTPAGEWEALSVLYPYANLMLGDLITPVRTMGVIISNVVTLLGHKLQSGDAVYVVNTTGGALPTGLSASTLYYIYSYSGDAVTFHTNHADALVGTNPIACSGGTGTNRLVVNNPLTIQTFAGKLLTFPNAAVTKMPEIIGSAIETLLGEVEFDAFLVDAQMPSGTASLYTLVDSPYLGDTSFVPANVLTQPIVLDWGAVAPWNAFQTKSGIRVDAAITLEDVDIDSLGTVTKRFAGLVVTARGQPVGISEKDVLDKLMLQGAGAAIGRSLTATSDNLNLSATGFYVRLYGAALRGGPLQFSSRNDRVGELTWVATRTFTGGVPNPLFAVFATNPIT
jgi:hypothetical protein